MNNWKQHLNAKTVEYIERKFTEEMQSDMAQLKVVPAPIPSANDVVIFVDEIPPVPKGWQSTRNSWLEANVDGSTMDKVAAWRMGADGYVLNNTDVTLIDQTPIPHVTNLFTHNPLATVAIENLRASMPTDEFEFDTVSALGPPGKENCWVAETHDERIVKWLQASRDEAQLNRGHPQYVEDGGYPFIEREFDTVRPHVTLVRNIEKMNKNKVPSLGVLKGHKARLTSLTEWVTWTRGTEKIKLAKHYA